MKNDYSREKIINNILVKEIIRIDFFKIESLEDIITTLKLKMEKLGYELNTDVVHAINIEIEDPDPLITQNILKAKKINNETLNYIFKKEGHRFILNEYVLIFENDKFKNYKKLDQFYEPICCLLEEIIKEEKLAFQRIGVRKINSVLLNDIKAILKYYENVQLDDQIINQDEQIEIVNLKKKVSNEDISYNSKLDVRSGFVEGHKDIIIFQVNNDIDCYIRGGKYQSTNEIKELFEKLNFSLFNEFKKMVKEDLLEILSDENLTIKELSDNKNIIGGVNLGKHKE